jgi:hypothetical protein
MTLILKRAKLSRPSGGRKEEVCNGGRSMTRAAILAAALTLTSLALACPARAQVSVKQHPKSYVGDWCMTNAGNFERGKCMKWSSPSLTMRPDGFERFEYSCRLVADLFTSSGAYQGTYFCREKASQKRWLESNLVNPVKGDSNLLDVEPTKDHLACHIYIRADDRKRCRLFRLDENLEQTRIPIPQR